MSISSSYPVARDLAEAHRIARTLRDADCAVRENPGDPEAEARLRKLMAEQRQRLSDIDSILTYRFHARLLKLRCPAADPVEPQQQPREAQRRPRETRPARRHRRTSSGDEPDPACSACYRGLCVRHLSDAQLQKLVRGVVQANRAVDSYQRHHGLTPPRPSLSDLLRSGS